jgi:hypothetical protein
VKLLHHRGERRRDVRDVHQVGERAVDDARTIPAIAPAWPTARVSFDFQRPTTQATTGLPKSTPCS